MAWKERKWERQKEVDNLSSNAGGTLSHLVIHCKLSQATISSKLAQPYSLQALCTHAVQAHLASGGALYNINRYELLLYSRGINK